MGSTATQVRILLGCQHHRADMERQVGPSVISASSSTDSCKEVLKVDIEINLVAQVNSQAATCSPRAPVAFPILIKRKEMGNSNLTRRAHSDLSLQYIATEEPQVSIMPASAGTTAASLCNRRVKEQEWEEYKATDRQSRAPIVSAWQAARTILWRSSSSNLAKAHTSSKALVAQQSVISSSQTQLILEAVFSILTATRASPVSP